jgi:hypothetical protein
MIMTQQTRQPNTDTSAKHSAVQNSRATAAVEKRQQSQGISEEQRHSMIAEAAYLLAAQRDFQGDLALHDWLSAEEEVAARFAERH